MSLLPVSFSGKKVLVTGGGQGLGRTIIKKLYGDGAIIFTLEKEESRIQSLKEEFPGITAEKVDLADFESTKRIVESFGPVDHLVNNAGIVGPENFLDITNDTLTAVLDVNFKALIAVGQTVAKGMIKNKSGGSIVNLSSCISRVACPGLTVYSCTKAAIKHLTKMMATELGEHNIRVNCISPTVMDTPMGRTGPPGAQERQAEILNRGVLKRYLQPEEAADLVIFLLSPLSSMITGEDVFIDAGFSIH